MKKLFMFAVAALVALTGFSATVDDLFNYVEQQGGTVMDLPQEMVTMMMQQQNSKEAESLKNIKSMKMGMIGNPTEAQKAGLKAIADEGIDDYLDIESLMAMMGQKMDTGDAKVFMQMNPETEKFTSFIIVALEGSEISVIKMDGDLTFEDLNSMK